MIDAWILPDGTVIDCTFPKTHLSEASRLFPNSDNAEQACEKLNYVKMCENTCGQSLNAGAMYVQHYESLTQAQLNKIQELWENHYAEKKTKES